MPRQGQSVESCVISKWNKKKGDRVEAGDILFSYETDKASFDEEAKSAGILLDIFFDEGDDVPCLMNVCVIGNEGEDAREFNPNQKQHNPTQTQNMTSAGEVKISPRARKLAEKAGIDYRGATPTGPDGRILEKDIAALRESGRVFTASAMAEQLRNGASAAVEGTGLGGRIRTGDLGGGTGAMTDAASAGAGAAPAALAAAAGAAKSEAAVCAAAPATSATCAPAQAASAAHAAVPASAEPLWEEVRLPNIRKVIARSMHQSLSTMAQLTLNTSFDATDILEFRRKLKENRERLDLENITINDIIIYAVSRTLANHKSLNAHFLDDRMLYFKNVNMGVAVDTDRGLMVPTLFDANLKPLNEISAEVKRLAKDCQAGAINPDLLRNGSFTVTNLGTLDIESFTPVINSPQTGILGVDSIVQRAREAEGEIEFYPAMGLSLTFDHRAVDGAPAARFLKELKTNLESFSVMLAR